MKCPNRKTIGFYTRNGKRRPITSCSSARAGRPYNVLPEEVKMKQLETKKRILDILAEDQPLTTLDLADRIDKDRAWTTILLNRLYEEGLVKFEAKVLPEPPYRRRVVIITDQGREEVIAINNEINPT